MRSKKRRLSLALGRQSRARNNRARRGRVVARKSRPGGLTVTPKPFISNRGLVKSRHRTMLVWQDSFIWARNAVSFTYNFRCNDIFSPGANIVGADGSCKVGQEYAAFYKRYRVNACKVVINLTPIDVRFSGNATTDGTGSPHTEVRVPVQIKLSKTLQQSVILPVLSANNRPMYDSEWVVKKITGSRDRTVSVSRVYNVDYARRQFSADDTTQEGLLATTLGAWTAGPPGSIYYARFHVNTITDSDLHSEYWIKVTCHYDVTLMGQEEVTADVEV